MKNKVEEYKNLILNRVRFHAPVVYDDKVDKTFLFGYDVDPNLPIFKYEGNLNKDLVKAFNESRKIEKFNLLLLEEKISKKFEKTLKKIKNCVFFDKKSNFNFLAMINKLNINYNSSSNYNIKYKDKFIAVNDEILNLKYENFSLVSEGQNEILYSYKEFLLNGNNIVLKIKNFEKTDKMVKISLNLPLKKGFYTFKKQNGSVKITNLLTQEKMFFTFVSRNTKFNFSAIDGLENSSFATINLISKLKLKANEEKFFFFLLSNKKCPLKNLKDIEKLEDISKKKCCEIFDVRVKTKNQNFDQFFNNELPKKIWLKWVEGEPCEDLIEKYLTLRRLFVRGKEKLNFKPFKEIGLKELGVFNGEYYKKILISFGREKFLQVGKTKFTNISNVTNFSLKKKDPILLSFDV